MVSSWSAPSGGFASSTSPCTGASQGGTCADDAADHCSEAGNTCVDAYRAATFECRASAGQCDVAEFCTGSSGSCPADGFASSTTSCTGASQAGTCDDDAADHCTGTGNSCGGASRTERFECR